MKWLLWSMTLMAISGLAAWSIRHKDSSSRLVGAGGCVWGCALGLWGVLSALFSRVSETQMNLWNVPFGSLTLGVDGLSRLFLAPLFIVGGLAAVAALRQSPGDYAANRPREHWFFYNFMLAACILVVMARNAVLFLFAWEIMTLAAFLLVENDQRESGARSGGWVFLVAGHLGGACLLAMFALLGGGDGRLDFNLLGASGGLADAVFVLACAGFGAKMGLFPFHAWYAESYPTTPGHVCAVFSGVVGNLALYGMFRTLEWLGASPPDWWGYALLAAGLATAVVGAIRALTSRDLFRLLAWSSVENYGLMATGMGIGLLGAAYGRPFLALLGFATALFHMLNHSVAKSLLFLSASLAVNRAGTRSLDRMGGLLRRLPLVGGLFLIGALGAACLPPLNGFAGEFLLFLSALAGIGGHPAPGILVGVLAAAIAALALTGGLAAAAYARVFSFVFLGAPRSPSPNIATPESGGKVRFVPPAVLAFLALCMALSSPVIMSVVRPAAERAARTLEGSGGGAECFGIEIKSWESLPQILASLAEGGALLLIALLAAFALRRALFRGKPRGESPTWDCGYARPTPRMQYNASSFARPLTKTFGWVVGLSDKIARPEGLFPRASSFASSLGDINTARGYRQIFGAVGWLAAKARVLQAGRAQLYLLYIAVILIALLLWKM